MTTRDWKILLLGLGAGVAVAVWAQDGAAPARLESGVYAWDSLPVEKTASGERRAVFDSATATTDRLETHVTTLNPGTASHAAHRHADKELVYVREGVIEATINGESHRAPA